MTTKAEAILQSLKDNLMELIPSYKEHKTELKELGELTESENAKIKDYMGQLKTDRFIVGDWVAAVTDSKRESFNEPKLIELLKKIGVKGIIKKKEYVDMDALENAIYNKEIEATAISSAKETKTVTTLRILKKKKGE